MRKYKELNNYACLIFLRYNLKMFFLFFFIKFVDIAYLYKEGGRGGGSFHLGISAPKPQIIVSSSFLAILLSFGLWRQDIPNINNS